jgi:hypothetical protein
MRLRIIRVGHDNITLELTNANIRYTTQPPHYVIQCDTARCDTLSTLLTELRDGGIRVMDPKGRELKPKRIINAVLQRCISD